MGKRSARRQKRLDNPPVVLANAPPTLIPEDLHTSPHKIGNPNSEKKLRDAPPGVPLKERKVYKLKSKYKSKTNELATLKNGETIDLMNKCGDLRCESFNLQDTRPQNAKVRKAIVRLNERAKNLVAEAQAKAAEVEEMGEKAVKVPAFLLTDPVL